MQMLDNEKNTEGRKNRFVFVLPGDEVYAY